MPKHHRTTGSTICTPPGLSAEETRIKDTAEKLISRRIIILANVVKRTAGLRRRRILDLTAGEWGVVAELGIRAPQSLGELSNGIGLDKTQLSKSVSGLVARGLVLRRIRPDNNRQVLLSLTAPGRRYFQRIIETGIAMNDVLLVGLALRERKILIDTIERLTMRARVLLEEEQNIG